MLTKEHLQELFEYKEGEIYWKISPANQIKIGTKAGTLNNTGYLHTTFKGKIYLNHRIIFMMHHGYLPKQVDHKDNNTLNNSIENLRGATPQQNSFNALKRSDSVSGIKGVGWEKRRKKWRVQFKIEGVNKHLGYYDDIELATLVAQEARNKYHGEFVNHGE